MTAKIRVENLSTVVPSVYGSHQAEVADLANVRPFSILMVNCYQPIPSMSFSPPLGILYLISAMRRYFGDKVSVKFVDMRVSGELPMRISEHLDECKPDIVGVSALNCETQAAFELAERIKQWNEHAVAVVGGPLALHQAEYIFSDSRYDWVFNGAAERTFPLALARFFSGADLGSDIPGFSYRDGDLVVYNEKQDLVKDLDSIPMPAWDLVDLDAYSLPGRTRMTPDVGGRKYAPLLTSRGCPYLCNYCHDVFTKRFVYRSDDSIIEEVGFLYENYGVTEFHISDDIFNLHRPRALSFLRKVSTRWPGQLHFAFPNGLRGDILDEELIQAFVDAGTFQVTIAIETVTPRLQDAIEKFLDVDRTFEAIKSFSDKGVIVTGSFMLGFPTETVDEIKKTIRRAVSSGALIAHFFAVVPQPKTPIYEMACGENEAATLASHRDEQTKGQYNTHMTWYQRAYGYPLHALISATYFRFYFHPKRFFRILRTYPLGSLLKAFRFIAYQTFKGGVVSFYHGLRARLIPQYPPPSRDVSEDKNLKS